MSSSVCQTFIFPRRRTPYNDRPCSGYENNDPSAQRVVSRRSSPCTSAQNKHAEVHVDGTAIHICTTALTGGRIPVDTGPSLVSPLLSATTKQRRPRRWCSEHTEYGVQGEGGKGTSEEK